MKQGLIVLSLMLFAISIASAQNIPGPRPTMTLPHRGDAPEGDALAENFFPPEVVMHHRKAIDLTDQQRDAIREEMQKTVKEFTELQWQQEDETEKMAELAKQASVDEKKVLAELDKLVGIENQIKRLHLTTMIRVKNILSAEQQAKLKELKQPRRGGGGSFGGGGFGGGGGGFGGGGMGGYGGGGVVPGSPTPRTPADPLPLLGK